jgi:hypothetical protein
MIFSKQKLALLLSPRADGQRKAWANLSIIKVQMTTKTLITVLLVTIVLISCAPAATTIPPTETAVPTVTVTVPAPTSTPLPTPTQIPATATEAGFNLIDYLKTSNNVFPLTAPNEFNQFFCRGDWDNIIYQNHSLPDGTVVKAWLKCLDGGQTFLVPLFIENDQMLYPTMAPGVTLKNTPYEAGDLYVRGILRKNLAARTAGGLSYDVMVVIGSGSHHLFDFGDPYPAIWAATNLDETMLAFMATGDPRVLPELPGVKGKILFGFRISSANPRNKLK